MKKEEIARAALDCFTDSGYEGASLAQIAEAVGLKKQSLYAHFADKDAIFLAALSYSKAQELRFYEQFFAHSEGALADVLQRYLAALATHFRTSRAQQFWLRMNFYPPQHLAATVEQEVESIYLASEQYFAALFAQHKHELAVTPLVAADAFIALTNALLTDILYNTPQAVATRRVEASWHVFYTGIKK